MAVQTLSLKGTNSADVASQAKKALQGQAPEVILFFASSSYNTSHPAEELKQAFPESTVIGCTSHSEFCNADFTNGSFSIMAIDKETVEDIAVEVITDLDDPQAVVHAANALHNHFGGTEAVFNHFDRYVGIILFESSAKAEETVMDRLGTASDVLFVGGSSSAGDDGVSRVYADGKSYEKAAVLALLKTTKGYDILKTQSASVFSERKLTATKSDLKNRILYEFDNRPCGEVYAEVLGVPVDQIQDYFVSNPLGVIADDEIFIRTFNEKSGDGITLHCGIAEGTEINVLKIGDIVDDTQKALGKTISYEPAGVVNFNCLYRTLEIQNRKVEKPYCALFGRYPSIGFSTSGEAFLGHINETSTVLVLK